jgi:hypothetical protein
MKIYATVIKEGLFEKLVIIIEQSFTTDDPENPISEIWKLYIEELQYRLERDSIQFFRIQNLTEFSATFKKAIDNQIPVLLQSSLYLYTPEQNLICDQFILKDASGVHEITKPIYKIKAKT